MTRSVPPLLRALPHLAAIVVILLFARLAVWQFDRAEEKRSLLSAWEAAPTAALNRASPLDSRYTHVRASGRFDPRRHVLLDNQIRGGQPGVHVFTPFTPDGSRGTWLVNRGWHALPSRQGRLPEIPTPEGRIELTGRLVDPPRVGRQIGKPRPLDSARWPNLVTYMDLSRVEAALEADLADRVILLDPSHETHLTGDAWQPVTFGPDRHLAYAWQWITMAAAVFFIWVALTWRTFRKS